MTVKELKEYLNFYKDEQTVNFKLPSNQSWVVDEKRFLAHNLQDQEKRENCNIYLK